MFRNIGGKIKVFVIVAAILGIITCICFGGTVVAYSLFGDKMLSFLSETWLDEVVKDMTGDATGALGVVTGIVIMTVGSLLIYLAAFIPYGLGQLIQNTDRMVKSLDSIKNLTANMQSNGTQGGVYPYPVYTDEYGRPYYHVPDDLYYTEEHVEDGDLVPEGINNFVGEPPADGIVTESEGVASDAREDSSQEKSANDLMEELIRKNDENKGATKHDEEYRVPENADPEKDGNNEITE